MTPEATSSVEGHGGDHAVAVAPAHGVETLWTLSGAHVFPMYDGAVKAEPAMRLVVVRYEPTAVFAAEGTGKLTRVPELAVLTAVPGVTNGVSPIAQVARRSGLSRSSPGLGTVGRRPAARWRQPSSATTRCCTPRQTIHPARVYGRVSTSISPASSWSRALGADAETVSDPRQIGPPWTGRSRPEHRVR